MKNPDNFRMLRLDRDWHKDLNMKEGEVYFLQDVRWDIETQNHFLVLEKIGNPVEQGSSFKIDIVYK